jgi:hypothetical protein
MSINKLNHANTSGGVHWFYIQNTDVPQVFNFFEGNAEPIVEIRTDTGSATVEFLNSSNSVLGTASTAAPYTKVPQGTVKIRVSGTTNNTSLLIRPFAEDIFRITAPNVFTSSQSITVNATRGFALLGGGGAGGGLVSGSGGIGSGAGSGYLTTGVVNAGTYSLVVGAGATGVIGNGGNGGTSTFAGFSAAGGQGAGNQTKGGDGGSAGVGNSNTLAGGSNGSSTDTGIGSGVLANMFVPGPGGAPQSSQGGGTYAGGARGATTSQNGGNGYGIGGGGGGSISNTNAARSGGSGAGGGLILFPL